MHDVIVIGGGPAGVTAALRARELGASVALVERGRLGGTCTNDGCVPTRVLAKAARLLRDTEQLDEFGLFGARPMLDFAELLTRTQHTVYTLHEKKQLIGHLEQSGVTVYANAAASFVDEHALALNGDRRIEGDKFIVCAGGHARRLPFPGAEHALTHSDVWSLKTLPKSIIIVGGAATGSQLASIFAAFGSQVTLLDLAPRLMPLEDELVSQTVRAAFEQRGVQVITGIGGIDRIEKTDRALTLHYKHRDQLEQIEAEAIVLAVGWPGNLEALNLAAARVATTERGYIVVDDYLRTSTPHIFAAGDVTGRMMLVQSASYDARVAAENAVLGTGQPYQRQIVPHGGFTDPEYGSVGLTETQARAQEACVVAVVPYADLDRAVIDDRTQGFGKLIVSQENHRILGAHVVGEQALEIVHLVAAAMSADMWVEQLAELEIAYPTYTAVVGLAARQIVRELGVMPLAAQWRALGQPHLAEWERSERP
jgi:pyruvate/2-oxoglutarate dehydrogenase complex dihydrolipoamide dehydrogenase (E3) component